MQCSKINTHSGKCMILLKCLTSHLVPESSPTPSHSPKPRMRIIMFIFGQPSDVYIYIYIYIYIYPLGHLRRLILFMDYPPIIIIFRQPSETILSTITSCTHSYHPRVPRVHMECMMPIPFQFNNTCKYIIMHIFT